MASGSSYNGQDPRSAGIHTPNGALSQTSVSGVVAPLVPGHTSGSNPGAR